MATLFRDIDSWNSVTSKDGKTWSANTENWDKDAILYEKTGLNWGYYDSSLVEHYQTVDNLVGDTFAQPYNGYTPNNLLEKKWIQGNTVVSDFYMGYYTDGTETSGYKNPALIINNATTVDGTKILNDGRDKPDEPRWLGHDTSKKEMKKNNLTGKAEWTGNWIDLKTGKSDGCFITTIDNQKALLHLLNDWHFTNGVQIKGTINNMNYNYYMSHYPNTRGAK